jgi:hypothetical protein
MRTGRIAIAVLVLPIAYVLVWLFHPLHDFSSYWIAAKLFLSGQNPYSLSAVFAIERTMDWTEALPLMLLNPPWILPLIGPLAWLSYPLAWCLWSAVLALCLACSSRLLLNLYGPVALRDISDTPFKRGLFIFSFYPVLLCLRFSQTTPLVLLGLVGFLWYQKRNNVALAGLSLSLLALKPHLVYLVVAALLLRRSGKLIAWTSLPILLLSSIAVIRDVDVFREYFGLMRSPYVALQPSALGWILRMPSAWGAASWLQYLPLVFGLIWFAFYWQKHKRDWDWIERMPALITASVLTAAYGRLYDQALLAIPLAFLFGWCASNLGRLPRVELFVFTAVNITLIIGAMFTSPLVYLPAPILFAYLLRLHQRQDERLSYSRSNRPTPQGA